MGRGIRIVLVAVIILALPRAVRAEESAASPSRPEWSVTTNLVYLILPVVNASAEYRLRDRSTLSARAGVGRVSIDVLGDDDTNTVVELGAAYRYYLLGSFDHGAFLGADVRYVDAGGGALLNVEQALCVGGMAGYKRVLAVGFTFDVRLGAAIAFGEADSAVTPLVFVGAGWSL